MRLELYTTAYEKKWLRKKEFFFVDAFDQPGNGTNGKSDMNPGCFQLNDLGYQKFAKFVADKRFSELKKVKAEETVGLVNLMQ